MIFVKYTLLFFIFVLASMIGGLISKKYKNRVEELKSFKEACNILKSKIKFTYEPLGDIFEDISKLLQDSNINQIFKNVRDNQDNDDMMVAWESAINNSKSDLNLNKEDLNVIRSLGKMLGKTDVQGQLSEIDLNLNFLDTQIKDAEIEQKKNEKMYKSLGTIFGLAIIIILI